MYFTTFTLAFTGLTLALAQPYDDGQYRPYISTTVYNTPTYTSTTAYNTPTYTSTTAYNSPTYTSTTAYNMPTYTTSSSTWYYWSSNSSTYKPTTSAYHSTASYMPSNMTHMNTTSLVTPYNGTMTRTSLAPVYTTTVCNFESSCYTTIATVTGGGGGGAMRTEMAAPTMTPYSSSDRLVASGWGALLLCGIAMFL